MRLDWIFLPRENPCAKFYIIIIIIIIIIIDNTDSVADEANNCCDESNEDEIEPSQNPSEIEELVKEIKRARAEWENIRMAERPPLPKISVNRKAELLIKQANQAIQLVIAKETPNLNNINLLQYVTAYVISEKLGKTPKLPKTKSNKRRTCPRKVTAKRSPRKNKELKRNTK